MGKCNFAIENDPGTPGIEAEVTLHRGRQLKRSRGIIGRTVRYGYDPDQGIVFGELLNRKDDDARAGLDAFFSTSAVFVVPKVSVGND